MSPHMLGISLVAADNVEEMVLLSLPAALQKARCMTNGQPTPPPSPSSNQDCPVPTKVRTKAKFQSPRLVARCPPAMNVTEDFRIGNFNQCNIVGAVKQVDNVPSEPEDQTSSNSVGLAASSAAEHNGMEDSPVTTPPVELRRTPHSYFDLRGLAQEQEREGRLVVPSVSSPSRTPLLPSPIIDDRKMLSQKDSLRPFKFGNSSYFQHKRDGSQYKSYDDMQILSCYEDCQSESADHTDVHLKIYDVVTGRIKKSRSRGETPPSPCVRTSEGILHQRKQSAESDWLANTTSHQQRLHKFKSRCYQVIQHPFSANVPKYQEGEEGKVMLATVLVGPGRPKLVQIRRPTSSVCSLQSSQTPSNQSKLSLPSLNSLIHAPPTTPIHQIKEISAFSPYDTPSVTTPFTDISLSVQKKRSTPTEQTPISASKIHLVPEPLSISHRASSSSETTMFSTTERPQPWTLAKVFSFIPKTNNQKHGISGDPAATTCDMGRVTELVSSPLTTQRLGSRHQLEERLDVITSVIDDFPNTMLSLESPLIQSIRASASERKNDAHIKNLAKVFTNAPEHLLAGLVAWIMIDIYVCDLQSIEDIVFSSTEEKPRAAGSQQNQTNPKKRGRRKPQIPNRSTSLNTFDPYSSGLQLRSSRSLLDLYPMPPTYNKVSPPTRPPPPNRTGLQGTTTMTTTTTSDYDHDSWAAEVPSKARTILGLGEHQQQHSDDDNDDDDDDAEDERLLVTRAKALSVGIGVIAQRLIEAIKGEGGWDPYLWRSLSVVVQITETADF